MDGWVLEVCWYSIRLCLVSLYGDFPWKGIGYWGNFFQVMGRKRVVCAEGMGRSPIGHALGKLSEKVGTFSLTKPFFFQWALIPEMLVSRHCFEDFLLDLFQYYCQQKWSSVWLSLDRVVGVTGVGRGHWIPWFLKGFLDWYLELMLLFCGLCWEKRWAGLENL